MQQAAIQADTRFLFLDNIYRFLVEAGLNNGAADLLTFLVACGILLLLVWILRVLGSRLISNLMRSVVRHSHSKWDYFLHKRKFYSRLINFVAIAIILSMSQLLFEGFGSNLVSFTEKIIGVYLAILGLQTFYSVMNAVNDVYETNPRSREKPIRSTIQTIEIVAAIVVAIIIILNLSGVALDQLLIGLGASAAIVSIVFRDVILSLVGSIQITSQEMVLPGDWIEMPSRSVNGEVEEINALNVKVRNWDNSVTRIPAYSILAESFTNWSNMLESEGRRFKRPIIIDVDSVKTVSPEWVEELTADRLIDPAVANRMLEISREVNHNPFTTNVGLFRCYLQALLEYHPRVVQERLRVARYLDYSEFGIKIELYAFSADKYLQGYEHNIADIFENIYVMAPRFGLKLFQLSDSSHEAAAVKKAAVATPAWK